ncbi:pilus assembly protein CpaE [Achromobacter sp. GG226]|nr:pilus assembly protein CpaE [Verticiella sp. GG226]
MYSADRTLAAALALALGRAGSLAQEADPARLADTLADVQPHLVFLDFNPDPADPAKLAGAAARAAALARLSPSVPRVALGAQHRPEGPLAALRAGVSDYVDPFGAPAEVQEVVLRLCGGTSGLEAAARSVAVLGVRAGVGASTFCAHLCDLAGRAAKSGGREHRVALLDLGCPVGDAQLYLATGTGEFDFAQAVQALPRLDKTLVRTAFATSAGGVTVVPLPTDLDAMQAVSHGDALALVSTLTRHFGTVVTDLGGFPNADFSARLAAQADEAWLFTDQSVGALVSLAQTLRDLEARGLRRSRLRLIVNRYDPAYGMSGEQIAQRFGMKLLGEIPDRTRQLMSSANQGRLLHVQADADPYVRAVQTILRDGLRAEGAGGRGNWLHRLLDKSGAGPRRHS